MAVAEVVVAERVAAVVVVVGRAEVVAVAREAEGGRAPPATRRAVDGQTLQREASDLVSDDVAA